MTNWRECRKTAGNKQFCKKWDEVQNSTFVILLNNSAKLNICASNIPTSPSPEPLAAILGDTSNMNE